MTLAVGRISYLNAVPFFYHLDPMAIPGEVVDGVPSVLNARLAAGEIDLSPSSSFEYALHWRDYLLLPGLSISSRGPVQSVLLFSHQELNKLSGGGEILVTGESATSVNLLKVLLGEYCSAASLDYRVPPGEIEGHIERGASGLLIGDRALRMARHLPEGVHVYDLGELWYRHTGRPFVFALWIVRRQVVAGKAAEVNELALQLRISLDRALADLPAMAEVYAGTATLDAAALVDYWQTVSYALDEDHLTGLKLYFSLCVKHGLLADLPELEFVAG